MELWRQNKRKTKQKMIQQILTEWSWKILKYCWLWAILDTIYPRYTETYLYNLDVYIYRKSRAWLWTLNTSKIIFFSHFSNVVKKYINTLSLKWHASQIILPLANFFLEKISWKIALTLSFLTNMANLIY